MARTRIEHGPRWRTNVGSSKKPVKFKTSRGVGTRLREPTDYVPSPGSPSLKTRR